MGLYDKYVIPRVIELVCGLKPTMRQREKIIHRAKGLVLEIGIGSGLNLPFYDTNEVSHLIGIDPFPHQKKLDERLDASPISSEFICTTATKLPMEDNSVDTVISTYTFCSIDRLQSALIECRRVLKPNGSLLFIEHGIAPDEKIRRVQNRINPIWRKISGGCNLNRDIPYTLSSNGFILSDIETMYLPGWKPATWNWWGQATIR